MDANNLTKEEINALYDIAIAMRLSFNTMTAPIYRDQSGDWRLFEPLHDDRSSRRLEVAFCLSMEVTEYGVFVRQTDGRLLLWKEFPVQRDVDAELHIVRRALFQAAWKVVCERAQQAEIVANS